MLVVLKKMIKETAVFFLLLIVIVAGFLQSFFALGADGKGEVARKVLHSMTQAFLDSPDFDFYQEFTPPFGLYLFYLYNFIVSIRKSHRVPAPPMGFLGDDY